MAAGRLELLAAGLYAVKRYIEHRVRTMSDTSTAGQARDQKLVTEVSRSLSALQQSIHAAVEAGLKVAVTVESMHAVGEHYPEPLVEVGVERVITLI